MNDSLRLYFLMYNYPDAIAYDTKITYERHMILEAYELIPFEFKIGLLNFVCRERGAYYLEVLYSIQEKHDTIFVADITKIFGETFLKSIL